MAIVLLLALASGALAAPVVEVGARFDIASLVKSEFSDDTTISISLPEPRSLYTVFLFGKKISFGPSFPFTISAGPIGTLGVAISAVLSGIIRAGTHGPGSIRRPSWTVPVIAARSLGRYLRPCNHLQ